MNQLKGKTLIIAKGTTAESYFEKNEPDVKLQKYDQYADAYNALLDGRGDAFSTDNTEVLAWAKSNKGFKVGITKLGDEDTIAPAVQKGNKELLNWLNDEIVKLGKENFFHKDYEETLKPVYGSDVDPMTLWSRAASSDNRLTATCRPSILFPSLPWHVPRKAFSYSDNRS